MTSAPAPIGNRADPAEYWHTLLRPAFAESRISPTNFSRDCAPPNSPSAIACTARSCVHFFFRPKTSSACASSRKPSPTWANASSPRRSTDPHTFRATSSAAGRRAPRAPPGRLRTRQHGLSPRRFPAAGLAEVRRVQRRISGRRRLLRNASRNLSRTPDDGGFLEALRSSQLSAQRQTAGRADRQLYRLGRHLQAPANRHRGLARGPHVERIRNPASRASKKWASRWCLPIRATSYSTAKR